jgi:enediyne biosynthesis protein E4
MRRSSRATIALAATLGVAGAAGCEWGKSSPAPQPSRPSPVPSSTFAFKNIAETAHLDFEHTNGFDGKRYRVVETVNGGVALLDHDGDGLLDIYLTNGRKLEPGARPARDALFRNEGGSFRDVTAGAGLGDDLMSLGCAVADIDGNGFPDIHVTNDGPDRLYRNDGGKFKDIAAEAGIAGEGMNSGSAFLDMDGDGDLDLYVAGYVVDTTRYEPCMVRSVPGYCPPRNYPPAPHTLYENKDGRFIDVSEQSGIRAAGGGRGLGVIAADFNDDGHADIYVANDTTANFMFLGDGKGRFVEVGALNGTGYGDQGQELGSMGLAAEDYDGDGSLDLCVTNYADEIDNLYRSAGPEQFVEMARHSGVAAGSIPDVAWGVGLFDFDGDGWRDLFIANGHLNPHTALMIESTSYPQPKRIFRNTGKGGFERISCGPDTDAPRVSRGAAFGDIDGDGDVDVVVVEANGRPELLRNEAPAASWCLVALVGSGRNRDAIGARVKLTAGGRTQVAERRSSGSYLSANDPRLHFGLGSASAIDLIEVRWPSGKSETHAGLPVRKLIRITEGQAAHEVLEPRP